ncbi:MAG: hypothetical protein E6G97_17845 [Alphaproteobacteria bacterium]|nr:MAG: hypothetical protein E6G97_17845 [Alphaproteobacteria bacterium]
MPYEFPNGVIDSPAGMAALLGTFWAARFPHRADLYALMAARRAPAAKAALLIDQLMAGLSAASAPLEKRDPLFLFDAVYSASAPAPTGGQASSPRSNRSYPPPSSQFQGASLLFDSPISPARALCRGADFTVGPDGEIIFLDDPTDGLEEKSWLVDAQLSNNWSKTVAVRASVTGQVSQGLQRLALAILKADYGGPSIFCLHEALAAIADAPVCQEDGEVFQYQATDRKGLLLVTDKRVYRANSLATLTVSEGQVLKQGEFLTDTVRVLAPRSSPPAWLTSLQLPAEWLWPSLGGVLTFENAQKALTVTLSVSGLTKVIWPMPDDSGRVTAFFNLLHAQGVAQGKSLANYLDLRPQPQATQPTSASLPASINPMSLLLGTVFSSNVRVAVLKQSAFGPLALGTSYLAFLRRLLPPGAGVLPVLV